MSLATYYYDPFHEPFFTVSDFNRLFESTRPQRSNREVERSENSNSVTAISQPRMDLHESKDKNEMTATFELPGMTKEEINVDVHNNRLVVSGQGTISNELDNGGYVLRERRFGKFSRTLPLPSGTKPEDIKAKVENGVLTVKFPKSQPELEQDARKVTVS